MVHPAETFLTDLEVPEVVFWSSGNNPTQRLFGLTAGEVTAHFKALYLLADRIVGAASFYYESRITRAVTDSLRVLFERGDALYFIDEDTDDFGVHGRLKREKSPATMSAYRDPLLVDTRSNELASLGHILRRPAWSISDYIADFWVQDLLSREVGTIGYSIWRNIPDEQQRERVILGLSSLAQSRRKDFVWDYIKPALRAMNLPAGLMGPIRTRLSRIYSAVTANLLGFSMDRLSHGVGSPYVDDSSRYDTDLFLACMESLGLRNAIVSLGAVDLITLKASQELTLFREFYFALIKAVTYRRSEASRWLPIYQTAAQGYSTREVDAQAFRRAFVDLCRSLGRNTHRYKRPLDLLLYSYDALNKLVVDDFIALVNRMRPSDARHEVSERALPITIKGGGKMPKSPSRSKVFISYSRQDHEWLRKLRVHLRPLERNGLLSVWTDLDIAPGTKWREEIKDGIASAKIAVLLVSSDFLNSEFIAAHELPLIFKAAERMQVRLLWISIGPSLYTETEISKYQALNDPAKPLALMSKPEQDRELVEIAKKIKDSLV